MEYKILKLTIMIFIVMVFRSSAQTENKAIQLSADYYFDDVTWIGSSMHLKGTYGFSIGYVLQTSNNFQLGAVIGYQAGYANGYWNEFGYSISADISAYHFYGIGKYYFGNLSEGGILPFIAVGAGYRKVSYKFGGTTSFDPIPGWWSIELFPKKNTQS